MLSDSAIVMCALQFLLWIRPAAVIFEILTWNIIDTDLI